MPPLASESKRLGTAALDWPLHYPPFPLLPAGVCGQRTSCHCTRSCSSWGNRAGGRHHCVWSSVWNYSTSESHNTNRHTYPPGHQKTYKETEKERKRHMEYRMRLINKIMNNTIMCLSYVHSFWTFNSPIMWLVVDAILKSLAVSVN